MAQKSILSTSVLIDVVKAKILNNRDLLNLIEYGEPQKDFDFILIFQTVSIPSNGFLPALSAQTSNERLTTRLNCLATRTRS